MKLKSGIILHKVGGEFMAAATGKAAGSFSGFIRNNETADFIYRQLMEEITEEELVNRLYNEYAADKEVLRRDLREILDKLRKAGLLEE